MKKTYEILKIIIITTWSLIGIILLIYLSIPTGKFLYEYADMRIKQPLAEKTVQAFIKHYNNKDSDYIYNNLADDGYKGISSKEEIKKEILSTYNKYGKIVWKEKGSLGAWNENHYCYFVTMYQKTPKDRFEMSYKFIFAKYSKNKNLKLYGYRYENIPVEKWNQPANDYSD